ncbi:MAG: DoxX-like family protein [Cellvibrionales bacterium]|nr:DoxX-like family protein [Cellvibrionales bacterium]
MPKHVEKTLRFSLAFLWVATAITATFFDRATGLSVLAMANISGNLALACIYAGSLVNLVIGLWLLTPFKREACYYTQISIITIYSSTLSVIAPTLWFHPFGPLTKNIPIIAIIVVLLSIEKMQAKKKHD